MGQTLDTMTTIEDGGYPDATKYVTMPFGVFDPPVPPDQTNFHIIAVHDLVVDRLGSVIFTADIQYGNPPVIDYRAIIILNRLNGYAPEQGAAFTYEDENGDPVTSTKAWFDNSDGFVNGDTGSITIDTYFPFNRTELTYGLYLGHYNLLRDFVGVSFMTVNPDAIPPK